MIGPARDVTARPVVRDSARARRQRETNDLLREAADADDAARTQWCLDRVVTLNVDVARSIAGRFRNRGVAEEDLDQVACLGLVRAAQRFDPDQSEDFLTFATPTIRGELKRYFRDLGWAVRPPRRVQEAQSALFASGLDLDLGVDRLAERLALPRRDVTEALTATGCSHPTSLDRPLSEDGSAYQDLLADDRDDFAAVDRALVLSDLVSGLGPRDRLLLHLRFVEERTQEEIGDQIGVTQMQVSRLLTRILRGLRQELSASAAELVA